MVAGKRTDVLVGYSCNNNCKHCMVSEKRPLGDRTTAECKDQMRQGKDHGAVWIQITGGEPTMRSDIVELVRYASEVGFNPVQMLSNARMFRYRDFTRRISRAGLSLVAPAVHGPNAALHDAVTRVPGSFDQTIEGIRNLRDEGVYVMPRTVITALNYTTLPAIAGLMLELDVDQYEVTFVRIWGNAQANRDEVVPRMSDVAPYVQKAADVIIDAGKPMLVEGISYCRMEGYEDIMSDPHSSDVEVRDLAATTESFLPERRSRYKTKGEGCTHCCYRFVCEGVWREYVELFGMDEFTPVPGQLVGNDGVPENGPAGSI